MMGILQQTTFSVTQYKQNVNVQLSYFIKIDTKIRNLCSLKPDIPWRGLRGSLNCIQKRSWFHKWLVHTSKVKEGYFSYWYFQFYEWLINHLTISQHSQSLTSSSRAKPRGSGRRLMFYCLTKWLSSDSHSAPSHSISIPHSSFSSHTDAA